MPKKETLPEFEKLSEQKAEAMMNIANTEELGVWVGQTVDARLGWALRDAAGDSTQRAQKAKIWAQSVGRKWVLRHGARQEWDPTEAALVMAPGWVREAKARGDRLGRLSLLDREAEKLGTVLDWMVSSDGPDPLRDWSKVSFEQAVEAEKKWVEARSKAQAKRDAEAESLAEEGVSTVLNVRPRGDKFDGWRWVKVESAKALDREGSIMRHCVGSYASRVKSGHCEIYSLRDEANKPKLTVEAHPASGRLSQLKAVANGRCPPGWADLVDDMVEVWDAKTEVSAMEPDFASIGWYVGKRLGLCSRKKGLTQSGRTKLAVAMEQLVAGGERKGLGALAAGVLDDLSQIESYPWTREAMEVLLDRAPSGSLTESVLARVARGGDKALVERVMAKCGKDVDSDAAMVEAARGGHWELAEALSVKARDRMKLGDALCAAVESGEPRAAGLFMPLADAGAKRRALSLAAGRGDVGMIAMLLPGADLADGGIDELSEAARGGSMGAVEMLLGRCDPTAGESAALRAAAAEGRLEIVERLLKVCDAKACGSAALRMAAAAGHANVVKALLPHSDAGAYESEALMEAAGNGHAGVVKLLMGACDPKAGGSGALSWAAMGGHTQIVEMLLPVSDPMGRDSEALRFAAQWGRTKIAQMLLEVSDCSACGHEALRLAASSGSVEIVRMLAPKCDDIEAIARAKQKAGGGDVVWGPLDAQARKLTEQKSIGQKLADKREAELEAARARPPKIEWFD